MEKLNLEDAREVVRGLEEERDPWIPLFQDLQTYLLPDRGLFPTVGDVPNTAESNTDAIYDSTGTRSLRVLAAGMQGGLTSPARAWFQLGLEDRELEEFGPVRWWLSAVEKIMYQTLAASNFYQEAHSVYIEQAGFGTSALLVDENPRTKVRFRGLTIGTYAIGTNALGQVDTLCRRTFMTPQILAEKFGEEAISRRTKERLNAKSRELIECLHLVMPRNGYDDRKSDAANMPFASYYWETMVDSHEDNFLRTSGYQEFPFLVPRWRVVGDEVWGRCPGMDAFDDIRLLQEMDATLLVGIQKGIDPPTMGGSELSTGLRTDPGAHNIVDMATDKQIKALYDIQLKIKEAYEAKESRRNDVAEAFYNELFTMLANAPEGMTATEVIERQGEKLLLLGPVLERQQDDFHDPLIDRLFGILSRWVDKNGPIIPPAPPEIQGVPIRVQYISLLAMAQQIEQLRAIKQTATFAAGLSDAIPNAIDNIDGDAAVREVHRITGAVPEVVRTKEEIEALRQKRAAAIEKAKREEAMKETLVEGAQAAKALSETDLQKPSALTQLLGGGARGPA